MFVSCYAPLIIQSGCGFGITVQAVFLLVCHKADLLRKHWSSFYILHIFLL